MTLEQRVQQLLGKLLFQQIILEQEIETLREQKAKEDEPVKG